MAFVLSLLYIAVTLLSPDAFPDAIRALHMNLILGGILVFLLPLKVLESKTGSRPEAYIGVALLVTSCLSMLATGYLTGTLLTFLDFAPVLIVFYMVAIACNSLPRLRVLVTVLFVVALFIFAQGLYATYSGAVTSPYLFFERIPITLSTGSVLTMVPRIRGLGVIHDPNDLAQVFVMLIPLLWLRWRPHSPMSNTALTLFPALILAVGVYYTHSRGGALALIAVVVYAFKDRLGAALSGVVGALALVGLLALNITGGRGITEDDGGRVAAWAEGLEALKSHPILGVGPGNYANFNSTGHTAHNSFVLAVVELGFVGYFFWMGMIVCAWTGLSALIRRNEPEKALSPRKARYAALHPQMAADESAPEPPVALTPAPAGVAMLAATPKERETILPSNLNYNFRSRPAPTHRAEKSDAEVKMQELVLAAKTVRVSFVGLLVAGFFLSRTYAVSLYIILGIAVVIVNLDPERPDVDLPRLVKTIALVCIASVVGLYLLIRLHGGG